MSSLTSRRRVRARRRPRTADRSRPSNSNEPAVGARSPCQQQSRLCGTLTRRRRPARGGPRTDLEVQPIDDPDHTPTTAQDARPRAGRLHAKASSPDNGSHGVDRTRHVHLRQSTARAVPCITSQVGWSYWADPVTSVSGRTSPPTVGNPPSPASGISGKWQAANWPPPMSRRRGSSEAQMSWAFQQRVRNRHPDGGSAGLGTSPSSWMRVRARWATGSARGRPRAGPSCRGAPERGRCPPADRSRRSCRGT